MYICICNKISDKEKDPEKLGLIGSKCGKCLTGQNWVHTENKDNKETKHFKTV